MNSQPLFTIILAGYQTEAYLPKALDSIARQSFRDFEVICYVEESSDHSLEICRNQTLTDSRFKVATGPRSGGVGATRNYGIDHAIGKYLVVVDGDDWLVENALQGLSRRLSVEGELDVLAFNAASTESDQIDLDTAPLLTNFACDDAKGIFTGLDAVRRSGQSHHGEFRSYTFMNIYRVDFLRRYRLYQKQSIMEDFEWMPQVWFHAQRFAYLDETLYVYRRRPNSIMTRPNPLIGQVLAEHFRSLLEFSVREEIPSDVRAIWSNQWTALFFWMMFHPVSSRRIDEMGRVKALRYLLSGENRSRFHALISRATAPKRLAYPLLLCAASGFLLPAKLYFQNFYYPLVERRLRQPR